MDSIIVILIYSFLATHAVFTIITLSIASKLYDRLGLESEFLSFWFFTLKEFMENVHKYRDEGPEVLKYCRQIRLVTILCFAIQMVLAALLVHL